MNEPLKKIEQIPQSYSPKGRPEILNIMENINNMQFATHESGAFSYRFDIMQLSESLKFIGCEKTDSVSEFDVWNRFDKSLIKTKIEPLTGIRLWQNESNKNGAWTFGCLANSIDDLPKGSIGVDTGWKEILVLTVRRDTVNDIYEKQEHYHWAHYDSWDVLPLEDHNLSPIAPGATRGFCTKNNGSTSLIEIYPAGLANGVPEMCFYYPLEESSPES